MKKLLWGLLAVVVIVVVLGGIYTIAMYASFTNACENKGGKLTSAGKCVYVKSP